MIHRLSSRALVAALVLSPLCMAAPADAEAALRRGDPAQALRELQSPGPELPAAEAAYWRGQALARLGRLEDAAESFHRVPQDHVLYPYAARGILYCAWRSPAINFVEVCAPLTAAAHPEVAQLALAALAEHQLRYTKLGDATSLTSLAADQGVENAEMEALVKLLKVHTYRREGDYDGGIEYARSLEQEDSGLSLLMRQRVRLELAELYYDKEAAAPAPQADAPEDTDDGKGEETLLQFITAQPDSPLLEEAFARLERHNALPGSEYTNEKLAEWAEDTTHPRRAALALYYQHREQSNIAVAASIANRASSALPGEPATRVILLEQVRRLVAEGKDDEAKLYLPLLSSVPHTEGDDARLLFLQAMMQRQHPLRAMELFMQSAEVADGALFTPALVNALICAYRCGDTRTEQALMEMPVSPRTHRALLLAHAGLLLPKQAAQAQAELQQVKQLHPTPAQATDAYLDEVWLALASAPEKARELLLACTPEHRRNWSCAQVLRYAALLEQVEMALKLPDAGMAQLECLYAETTPLPLKEALGLHLADRYTQAGHFDRALKLLEDLAALQSTGEAKAATLLYAGYVSAQLGSLTALEHAVRLYAESARQGSALTPIATIEQASLLVRINRTDEAFELLERLEQRHPNLSPECRAHVLTVRADAYGQNMTAESLAAALHACERIITLPKISPRWYARARLQHASLCTRAHRHEDALADYREVMQQERAAANPADEHSCFFFYYAAAGAVYQLTLLERYAEAAAMAEDVANWPGSRENPPARRGPKAEAFSSWAQSIRQTHYLPAAAQGN